MSAASRYDLEGRAEHYARSRFVRPDNSRKDLKERAIVSRLLGRLPAELEILDLPCGSGRFRSELEGRGSYLGGDLSARMIAVGEPARGRLFVASAGAIPMSARSCDLVFAMRLLHHLEARQRLDALEEFARVSRRWALVSIFLGPSLQGLRRRIRQRSGGRRGSRHSISRRRFIFEIHQAGFRVLKAVPVARWFSEQWILLLERRPSGSHPALP